MIDSVLGQAADLLALAGAIFFLIAAVGLHRLPDFYCRIHAPTKAASLGVLLLGLASAVHSLRAGDLNWIEDLAILVFLLLTVPVSSQLLARAARRGGLNAIATTRASESADGQGPADGSSG